MDITETIVHLPIDTFFVYWYWSVRHSNILVHFFDRYNQTLGCYLPAHYVYCGWAIRTDVTSASACTSGSPRERTCCLFRALPCSRQRWKNGSICTCSQDMFQLCPLCRYLFLDRFGANPLHTSFCVLSLQGNPVQEHFNLYHTTGISPSPACFCVISSW